MRTWAEVSRGQLAANYQSIRSATGCQVMGVVKANAYGHGAIEVSRTLIETGATWLAVSNTAEGVELRAAGIKTRILVMGGVLPFERDTLFDACLTPVVHSLQELRELDALGKPIAVHFKVDTGMARLGSRDSIDQISESLQGLRCIKLEGLMSHFASANDPQQSAEQIARFRKVTSLIRPEIIHFESSGALELQLGLTMVRPGIGLYGYGAHGVKPVLTWKACVIAVKELPTGTPVGYGARFITARPSQIAVLAAGYADGFPRALTNQGRVQIAGSFAPVIGAVSMDLTTIDVTGLDVHPGDAAMLLGEGMGAGDIAEMTGTISYEILTRIGNRVIRVYV